MRWLVLVGVCMWMRIVNANCECELWMRIVNANRGCELWEIFSENPYLIWGVIKLCLHVFSRPEGLFKESDFSALQNNFLPYNA